VAEQENTHARAGKVVQQAAVLFAGAEITAALVENGNVYGALPHLCQALGLDGESQRERIEEQSALAKGLWQFPLAQGKQLTMALCFHMRITSFQIPCGIEYFIYV
jgi:hypothetical protein